MSDATLRRWGAWAVLAVLALLTAPPVRAEGVAPAPTTGAAGVAQDHEEQEEEQALEEVGHVLGFLTVGLLAATICLSVFRRVKPRPMLAWHKVLGLVTLGAAVAHAAIMILH